MPDKNRLIERLHNQHITGTPLPKPEDVVALLGAVQSQDYPGAKWSLGQRVKGGTDAGVDEAFSAGRILRTHMLRPTWHFVLPADIRWMLRLTAPHVQRLNAYRYRQLELDARTLARTNALIEAELSGGRQRTRRELAGMLAEAGIDTDGQRLAYIAMHAELEGLVCSGALKRKQHTYALLEERVPRAPDLGREEALAELTRRFFTGHAPATIRHYVWWSGLSVADAKAGLATCRTDLECEVDADGTEWFGGARPGRPPTRFAAQLIPEYDESLTGSRDLGVPDLSRATGKKAWKDAFFRPVIIDGSRAGTWRRTITGGSAVLDTNLFATLDAAQTKALEAAAERYSRFLGMPVTLA
jgi:hypothetical protein